MANNFYIKRINKVIDYLEEHAGEKMTLGELAGIAGFSRYHFHRIFKIINGETLNNFMKRTLMEKAYKMLQTSKSTEITEIAFTLGYKSVANFSRDFKNFHGLTPTGVKSLTKKPVERVIHKGGEMTIRFRGIEYIPDKFVVFEKITSGYNPGVISPAFDKLYRFALEKRLKIKEFIGIGHDDPDYTPANKCRYDACMVVDRKDISHPIEYNTKTLKNGKYAVFCFEGKKEEIFRAWDYIFQKWLLNSEYLPANRPHLEVYLYSEKYKEGILKINLCLPVKSIKL
ncbi:MAG: AraC family transcriptional regulator [Bacteroidota bacterium]